MLVHELKELLSTKSSVKVLMCVQVLLYALCFWYSMDQNGATFQVLECHQIMKQDLYCYDWFQGGSLW